MPSVIKVKQGPRQKLEDHAHCFEIRIGSQRIRVLLVCDGVGGNQAGEVASDLACRVISSTLGSCLSTHDEASINDLSDANVTTMLGSSLRVANDAICAQAQSNPRLRGMATTVVAGLEIGRRFFVVWAGDSRAYLSRDGELTRLTCDHSRVQQFIDGGLIGIHEAKYHPEAHVITQYLGMADGFSHDVATVEVNEGDVVLISTDGLTDVLSDALISEHLSRYSTGQCDLETLAHDLVQDSLDKQTKDNVTVVVADLADPTIHPAIFSQKTRTDAYCDVTANLFTPEPDHDQECEHRI